ncbi:MAG: CYTH domain-containing protein [Candidatus Micrarchaeaceae archaeon]
MIEIETKIDQIDPAEVVRLLTKNGAKLVGKKLFRRWIFNLEGKKGEDRFIRVRTDGDTATLTYKHRSGDSLANTEEIETVVEDFDAAAKIISAVASEPYYQESRRTVYSLDNVEVAIDEWPKLPPIVEIEGQSEEDVKKAISRLGIKGRELGNIGWERVYSMYGFNLRDYKILKFEEDTKR